MNTTSNLNYTGVVTIKIHGNRKARQYNNGTSVLFRTIHSLLGRILLTGTSDDSVLQYLPSQMIITTAEDTTGATSVTDNMKKEMIHHSNIDIVSRELKYGADGIVFRGLLTSTNLKQNLDLSESSTILLVGGAGYKDQKILASAELPLKSLTAVANSQQDSAVQAEIEWLMKFGNK